MKRDDLVYSFSAYNYCLMTFNELDEDGDPLKMICTRHLRCVPDKYHPNGQYEIGTDPKLMTAFDANREEWVQFRCDSVLKVFPEE